MTNLRVWKRILKEALYYPFDNDMDTDHPECPKCGNVMDFYGYDDSGEELAIGEGYWKCDDCGFSITEESLYK